MRVGRGWRKQAKQEAKQHAIGEVARELLASERKELIELCLYALDRARSGGVAAHIERRLADVGVTAIRPDGERFAPARHQAGGTISTEDPELDGLIAETEVVGFVDRADVLRPPIVTVYTASSAAGEGEPDRADTAGWDSVPPETHSRGGNG